jgi:hypothetical protein
MISISLQGGLGNYLFQIASSYCLADDNGDTFVVDNNDIYGQHGHINTYKTNILRHIKFVDGFTPLNRYSEPKFSHTEIPYQEDLKLNGYYQSEKYFNREKILELFKIDQESKDYIDKKYGDVLKTNTCSIHVRRGDYLNFPQNHPVMPIEYYQKGIDYIKVDNYLIFSNDLEWSKDTFKGDNIIHIDGNSDYVDLYLMSMCNNNITANSSFSWWGAWLNTNEGKVVVSPQRWFGPRGPKDDHDLIPKTWTRL